MKCVSMRSVPIPIAGNIIVNILFRVAAKESVRGTPARLISRVRR